MDACDRIETVPVSLWNEENPKTPVPDWVKKLSRDICRYAGVPVPELRVMRVKCPTTFGGRWWDNVCGNRNCYKHAIGIILHPSHRIVHATTVHEHGHYLSRKRNGDIVGHHDDRFFTIVEDLYERFGVSVATARTIENGNHPESWTNARTWSSVAAAERRLARGG